MGEGGASERWHKEGVETEELIGGVSNGGFIAAEE